MNCKFQFLKNSMSSISSFSFGLTPFTLDIKFLLSNMIGNYKFDNIDKDIVQNVYYEIREKNPISFL